MSKSEGCQAPDDDQLKLGMTSTVLGTQLRAATSIPQGATAQPCNEKDRGLLPTLLQNKA